MTTTNPANITAQHISDMLEALEKFCQQFKIVFNKYGMEPLPNSIAATELNSLSDQNTQEYLESAYSMGIQSIDYACDYLMSFMDCIKEPALTVAPFTNVRGLMESCAIATFMLDPELTYTKRLEHSFSFRREGYEQQKKLARATSEPAVETRVTARDDRLNQAGQSLGFHRVGNRPNVPVRYGMKWPGITTLIGTTLDQEAAYRILSSFAHGHHWAIIQLGYEVGDHPTKPGQKVLEKRAYGGSFLYLGQVLSHALATATRCLWGLYGWDENDLDVAFEQLHSNVFDVLLKP